MDQKKLVFLVLLLLTLKGFAQIGGEDTYRFLTLTHSARVAALGGNQAALADSTDLNLSFHNPALLRESMTRQFLVNYVNYMADINYGYASAAFNTGHYGTAAVGIHYINYGSFTEADEEGNITGNQFSAAEYALNLIWSADYRNWRYGLNLKPVFSAFESYRSFGIAGDAGIAWFSPSGNSVLGVVARNFGSQLTTYYEDGQREPLPFDLQVGFSRKLRHAPVIFSVTANQLNNWNLADPKEDSGEFVIKPQENFGKQIMRHLLAGVEVMPSRNFTLRAGYNYHLRQELKLDQKLSTVGFSLGFGVKVKRFRLDYSTTRYHLAGTSSHFSLAINLNRFF